MAIIIVPEPRDPDVPILPPKRPDGLSYRFSLLYDGGRSRAYADSETELCTVLLGDAYAALDAAGQFTQRYFYCKQVQVWLQAAINGAPTVRPLLQQISADERTILLGERAQTVQIAGGVWTSPIPLVLITSEYAPITEVPRPVSQPPAGEDEPLIWLDPITESGFLRTLHQATVISVSVSDPPEHIQPPGAP